MIILLAAWFVGCTATFLTVNLLHSWPMALAATPLGGAVGILVTACLGVRYVETVQAAHRRLSGKGRAAP